MATTRALLTEREREILAGDADVSTNYLHQVRHRVSEKIDQLPTDMTVLKEYQPDLAEQFYNALGIDQE
jgi:hypothetical protein